MNGAQAKSQGVEEIGRQQLNEHEKAINSVPGASKHGHDGLRDHGQVNQDDIAFLHSFISENTGKLGHLLVELLIGEAFFPILCFRVSARVNGAMGRSGEVLWQRTVTGLS